MTNKTITLLPGSRNAVVFSANDRETVIHYTCPAYPGKICIYVIPGRWEINSQTANKVHLKQVYNLDLFELDMEKVRQSVENFKLD